MSCSKIIDVEIRSNILGVEIYAKVLTFSYEKMDNLILRKSKSSYIWFITDKIITWYLREIANIEILILEKVKIKAKY